MGLDVGQARIGVAISDPLGWTAQGLSVWVRRGRAADLAHLQELVRAHGVKALVVGLPRRTDGSMGPEARGVADLAREWSEALNMPVHFWDERFTTVEAHRTLAAGKMPERKRRQVVDQVAAALMLQAFLDHRRAAGPGGGEDGGG